MNSSTKVLISTCPCLRRDVLRSHIKDLFQIITDGLIYSNCLHIAQRCVFTGEKKKKKMKHMHLRKAKRMGGACAAF